MPKYKVDVTVTLSKKTKSEQFSSVIEARDPRTAVFNMIAGIFSDPSRKGVTVWYREYGQRAFPKGYQKPEKRLLLAAIKDDFEGYPKASAFPPNFTHPKIHVVEVKEEPKGEQLKLFAFGAWYVVSQDLEVPEKTLDKTEVDEIKKPKKEETMYAVFYRVLSAKGLNAFQAFVPKSEDPQEKDITQALLDKLRDTDSWILSDGPVATKLPKTAVKSEITVSDLRGMSSIQRKIEAYVDGDVAYVAVEKAFEGAPPPMPQESGQPQ